jgi:hypothetical protein
MIHPSKDTRPVNDIHTVTIVKNVQIVGSLKNALFHNALVGLSGVVGLSALAIVAKLEHRRVLEHAVAVQTLGLNSAHVMAIQHCST